MKSLRVLAVSLSLGLLVAATGCSDDHKDDKKSVQLQVVQDLYTLVQGLEKDLSLNFLLRSASDREKESFKDVLYGIKISAMRLQKNPFESTALVQLQTASQEFDKLNVLETDNARLTELKNKLNETIATIDGLQRNPNLVLPTVGAGGAPLAPGSTTVIAPPVFSPIIGPCTRNADSKKLISFQFTNREIAADFSKIDPSAYFSPKADSKYPTVVRFSGFKSSANTVGTSWLVSKTVDLAGATDVCLSVADDVYFAKATADLSQVQILVSTDFSGDVSKANWKTVEMPARKFQGGLVNADVLAPRANDLFLKDLIGEGAAKVTVAFKYTSSTASSAWWGISDITLTAIGGAPSSTLVPATESAAAPGPALTNPPDAGTTPPPAAPPVTPPATLPPLVPGICTTNPEAKKLFSFQFTNREVDADFTKFDPQSFLSPKVDTKYPGVIRFSGYKSGANVAATSWLVSRSIDVTKTKDLCVSVGDDTYFNTSEPDLNQVAILVSTDYAGDVATATWKTVELPARKYQAGLVSATKLSPASSDKVIQDLIDAGAAKVTIAFRYTSTAESAPWWGISDLTVSAVPVP